ncbi:MAG TPA: 3-deoxy-D-manno-octulosonic acid transferase [Alphaproteobacteria bacterium]|nr:3-deoxy-D-manno-octulosonic acid transferase [Alphaproteobacteria bacterium]
MILRLYSLAIWVAAPIIYLLLRWRRRRGKEDVQRFSERMGHAGRARPDGQLVWLHAASVGECLSVLPLIARLLQDRADRHVLITSGTVTSAQILAERLPARAIHHYVPVDLPWAVRRFLDHWRPDAAIWVESEFWPNLMMATAARDIPMALVNARISTRSYRRWRQLSGTFGQLMSGFAVIVPRDRQVAEYLTDLKIPKPMCIADLKRAAEPLPAEQDGLQNLSGAIGSRPVWLAASTHAGEEEGAVELHLNLRRRYPDLLTIIVPRHASRGDAIATMAVGAGLSVARRSTGQLPRPDTDLFLGDTMGEMGLFYRLSRICFMGGSLVPHGGQNPLEPARLCRAILYGPYIDNFAMIYPALAECGGAQQVADWNMLEQTLDKLLQGDSACAMGEAAQTYADSAGEGVLDIVCAALQPVLARDR